MIKGSIRVEGDGKWFVALRDSVSVSYDYFVSFDIILN